MKYFELIDKMMERYASGEFEAEAVQAKHEFNELAGILDDESSSFDMQINQFSDWYLFSRKLVNYGVPPIDHFIRHHLGKVPSEDQTYYKNLADNRYSLFEYLKTSKEDLHVRDMFSDYKLVIKNSPIVHGFDREQPFQARLIPHDDSFVFSMSYLFHPPEVKKFIRDEVKKVLKMPVPDQKEAREQLLTRLFRMRYKFEQYRHVGIHEIYSNDSRLRV